MRKAGWAAPLRQRLMRLTHGGGRGWQHGHWHGWCLRWPNCHLCRCYAAGVSKRRLVLAEALWFRLRGEHRALLRVRRRVLQRVLQHDTACASDAPLIQGARGGFAGLLDFRVLHCNQNA